MPRILRKRTLINVLTQPQNCLSRSSKSNPRLSRFHLFETGIACYSSHVCLGLARGLLSLRFHNKTFYTYPISRPCHMSASWHIPYILSTEKNLTKISNHEIPHCVILSSIQVISFIDRPISLSTLSFEHPEAYALS